MVSNPDRDEARREVAVRGLTPVAVGHLTSDALGTIDLAVLAPVKGLLKQFFSDAPWTAGDDDALAVLVGSGTGWWRHDLDDDFVLEFGWRGDAFRMEIAPRPDAGETFASPVVPEVTPNPRTIRFVTPPIQDGPSRWYESAAGVDDPRVARLFAEFDDVANVLVGPTFVAVGLHHPDRWEQLLDPVLRAITTEFTEPTADREQFGATDADPAGAARVDHARNSDTALETAWKELGSADQNRIIAAATSPIGAERQVAARLLVDAAPETAEPEWRRLLDDPSRGVRRAVVDAMVDAERPALRPLFEHALADTDAWTRWKALRGLVDLGIAPSREAVEPLTTDPDFHVRLEATSALRYPSADAD